MKPAASTGKFIAGRLRLLGTLAMLALLVFLLSQQGWAEIWAAARSLPAWRLWLALGLMVVSRLAVCGRWHVLLRSAGLSVKWSESLRVTFAGLFASNFLPTTIGGDVVRLAGLAQLRYDTAVGAASLITDRLVGMAGMALVLPFGLPSLLAPRGLGTGINNPVMTSPIGLTGQPGSSAGSDPAGRLAVGGVASAAWRKGRGWLGRIWAALGLWLRQPLALALALGFTGVHMACVFGLVALFFQALGEPLSFHLIAGLYSIAYFITLVPISINGYGLQEVSLTFVYSTLAGVDLSSSLTMALLYRTITMLVSLPGAWFVPAILAARSEAKPSSPRDD